jgi:predicted nucleic acid-binding protein
MIAVDTNVIAALALPTSRDIESAKNLLDYDRYWVAPRLWRSEFTNILATGIRNRWFDLDEAREALSIAEETMEGGEFKVQQRKVLELAAKSGCTGYDSEFVYLAMHLSIYLVTLDHQILKTFPEIAKSLNEFKNDST